MRHTIDAQDSKGFSNITAVYATPTTPGRCRAIIRNLFKFKSPIPRFFFSESCMLQHIVLQLLSHFLQQGPVQVCLLVGLAF